MPKISVVIPTFNRCSKVIRAIESVLKQTVLPNEIIVVDDGSSDNTATTLIKKFGNKIKIIVQENKGVSAARNTGIAASSCDLIAFLDSDDFWEPKKIEYQLPLFNDHSIILATTNWAYENQCVSAFDSLNLDLDVNEIINPLELLVRFEGHKQWLPTWIVRRSVLIKVGGFDERMPIAEDNRLLFRLAFEGKFILHKYIGTIRSIDVDAYQLTLAKSIKYHKKATPLNLEFLYETYARSYDKPPNVIFGIRRLISYNLKKHAEHILIDGKTHEARRRALEILVMQPRLKDFAVALMIICLPRVYKWYKFSDLMK